MIDDCKLSVVSGSEQINNGYDSKEDNRAALKSLSEIKLAQDQSAEAMAAVIVKHLETAVGVNYSYNSPQKLFIVTILKCYVTGDTKLLCICAV